MKDLKIMKQRGQAFVSTALVIAFVGLLGIIGITVGQNLITPNNEIEQTITGNNGLYQLEQAFGGTVIRDTHFALVENSSQFESEGSNSQDHIMIEAMDTNYDVITIGSGTADSNGNFLITDTLSSGTWVIQAIDITTGQISNSIEGN